MLWPDRLQGHALVQFESLEAAQRALQMDGQEMMGRAQFIQPADANQKDREPPPDCWFCLGSPAADQKLLISIGELFCSAPAHFDFGSLCPLAMLLCACPVP